MFGDIAPKIESNVPVWVRSGWDLTEKQFQDLAAAAGQESPVVFMYMPKLEADALYEALADFEAASETIDTRPSSHNRRRRRGPPGDGVDTGPSTRSAQASDW